MRTEIRTTSPIGCRVVRTAHPACESIHPFDSGKDLTHKPLRLRGSAVQKLSSSKNKLTKFNQLEFHIGICA